MGVSLHYRGKIKSIDLVSDLTHEVEDICITNSWEYTIYDNETHRKLSKNEDLLDAYLSDDDDELKKPDLGLRGITFRPHEDSESVSLLFDKEGVMRSVLAALFPYIQENEKYPWSFTKTQFAGSEAHVKVVNLLLYLQKKYFKSFKLKDDGGYYPKMDLDTLENRMGSINNAIGTLNDLFENATFEGDPDEVIDQIQNALSASLKDISIKVMRFDPEQIANMLSEMEDSEDDLKKEKDAPKPPRKRRKRKDDEEM